MGSKKKKSVFEDTRNYAPLEWCKRINDNIKPLSDDELDDVLQCLKYTEGAGDYEVGLNGRQNYIDAFYNKYSILENINLKIFYAASKWSKYKQVFKFDEDFLKSLLETDNIKIHKDFWDNLPFNDFYLDLSNCQDYLYDVLDENVDGIFVSICKEKFYVNEIDRIVEDYYIVWSALDGKQQTSGTLKSINETDEKANQNLQLYENNGSYYKKTKSLRGLGTIIAPLLYQVFNYLSQEKPDIKFDEEMKHTYKPRPSATKPRNRYSEVCKWDVGYRLGAEFRRWETNEKCDETSNDSADKDRHDYHSVKPHIRRAHWHYYWVGPKGAQVKEPRWIKEAPVGFKYNLNMDTLNELPAVIRKINSKSKYGIDRE